jgi:hypothetical protein
MARWKPYFYLILVLLIVCLIALTGCASASGSKADAAYQEGDYAAPDVSGVVPAVEGDDSPVPSEQKGDRLLAADRPYLALKAYLAALSSERFLSGDTEEQIVRVLEKSRRIVEKIRIEPLTAGMTVGLGRPFPSSFEARVIYGEQADGLSDVRLLVRHTIPGVAIPGSESLLLFFSAEDGAVSYKPPVPFFRGNGAVHISLDLERELAGISEPVFPGTRAADAFHALKRSVNTVQAVFPYRVKEAESKIVLGVLISDRDNAGNLTGGSYTASGIAGVFDSDLFDVKILEPGMEGYGENPREIARRLGEIHGRAGWLIYGNTRISEYAEKEGRIHITVLGSAQAMHFASEGISYSTGEMKKSVIGGNSRSTVVSAYRQLGKILGAEFSERLK